MGLDDVTASMLLVFIVVARTLSQAAAMTMKTRATTALVTTWRSCCDWPAPLAERFGRRLGLSAAEVALVRVDGIKGALGRPGSASGILYVP